MLKSGGEQLKTVRTGFIHYNDINHDVLLFELDNEAFKSDLIRQSIELGISIFFYKKSKEICFEFNNATDINAIIEEFEMSKPVIRFINQSNGEACSYEQKQVNRNLIKKIF